MKTAQKISFRKESTKSKNFDVALSEIKTKLEVLEQEIIEHKIHESGRKD